MECVDSVQVHAHLSSIYLSVIYQYLSFDYSLRTAKNNFFFWRFAVELLPFQCFLSHSIVQTELKIRKAWKRVKEHAYSLFNSYMHTCTSIEIFWYGSPFYVLKELRKSIGIDKDGDENRQMMMMMMGAFIVSALLLTNRRYLSFLLVFSWYVTSATRKLQKIALWMLKPTTNLTCGKREQKTWEVKIAYNCIIKRVKGRESEWEAVSVSRKIGERRPFSTI